MALAAEAACGLGDRNAAEVLYGQLLPFAGLHAYGPTEGAVGAVDRYLGLLADLLGRDVDAESHLRSAIRLNDAMQARPYSAHARRELARVLARRDAGARTAAELRAEAQHAAEEIGMPLLESRLAADAVANLYDQRPEDTRAVFRSGGDYWTVTYGGDKALIRDGKGMGYIASLLARPREEVHALQLALASQVEVAGAAESGRTIEGLQAAAGLGDSGSMLDPVAKEAYRERASDLRAEIAEAESRNDFERAERARHELEFLVRELGRAVGLGGRDRRAASSTERARLSVTRAIRSAMGRIAAQLPALGAHLDESIRTGTHCSYHPDSSADPGWVL
jgi:hypothetical protein